MSDPERSANIIGLIEGLPKDATLIYRTFGKFENCALKTAFISESPKFAIKHGYCGVHIPKSRTILKSQIGKLQVSASAHNLREIRKAAAFADYILISPIFPSRSKSALNKTKIGVIKLALLNKLFPKAKLVALGGINIKHVKRLNKTGVYGVAGVSFL